MGEKLSSLKQILSPQEEKNFTPGEKCCRPSKKFRGLEKKLFLKKIVSEKNCCLEKKLCLGEKLLY